MKTLGFSLLIVLFSLSAGAGPKSKAKTTPTPMPAATPAPVHIYEGTVYEQGSDHKKTLFTFQHEMKEIDGKEQGHGIFKDLQGNVVFEDTTLLAGSNIVKDEIQQKQLNQSAVVEVKDGKVFFSKTVKGETTTKDEKLGSTFVMAGNFQRFLKDHWTDIAKGDEVEFRYGVWDRQETVGFKIFKIGEDKVKETFQGKEVETPIIVLKMKPSSFVIAALVKPIIFKFAADGSHLAEMNGRVPPKKAVGNSLQELDAEVVYTYQ